MLSNGMTFRQRFCAFEDALVAGGVDPPLTLLFVVLVGVYRCPVNTQIGLQSHYGILEIPDAAGVIFV